MLGFGAISELPISGLPAGGGSVAYTLSCAAGSYTVTGQAATLNVSHSLTCAVGSYAINGQAATLTYTPGSSAVHYTLTCDVGSYAVTGQSATLKVSHSLTCAVGSYAITGQSATLKVSHSLSCAVGAYSITGRSATFNSGHSLTASAGAYSITGKDATLTYTPGSGSIAYTLSCAAGSYLINGQNALLFYTNNGVDTHDGWKKPKKPREWKDDRPALRKAILEAIDGPQAAEAVEVIAEYIKPTKSAYTPLATRIDWTALYRQADQVMAAIERLQDEEDHDIFMMML